MTPALYATIWTALIFLAAGEAVLALGRSRHLARDLHFAGAALNFVHAVIAMGFVHGWSHSAAVRATAAQTERVFGLDWGGGIWADYLFVAIWFMYAWRLGTASGRIGESPWAWAFRGFVLLMVVNGAIVFAAGWRRALGIVLVATLVWSWWRQARRSRSAWKNALV